MNILEEITRHKKQEIEQQSQQVPIPQLEKSSFFQLEPFSMKKALTAKPPGLIAEFKRHSPSKGIINQDARLKNVTRGYMNAGAAGLSILTDHSYFGGNQQDLYTARNLNACPILRKDFIIDEYQIIESKATGADLILLIAAILSRNQIQNFTSVAHNLGMETLLEIHDQEEIDKISPETDIVGINNRNLRNFNVQTETSFHLGAELNETFMTLSESGISDYQTILQLQEAGFNGFLIGETFMKNADPAEACQNLLQQIKQGLCK